MADDCSACRGSQATKFSEIILFKDLNREIENPMKKSLVVFADVCFVNLCIICDKFKVRAEPYFHILDRNGWMKSIFEPTLSCKKLMIWGGKAVSHVVSVFPQWSI